MEKLDSIAKTEIENQEDDSDSDSDYGLPPPIPQQKKQILPKLAIAGLGLSTVSKVGEKTAEEMADMEVLQISKNQLLNKK